MSCWQLSNTLQVDWGFDPADKADVRLHFMFGTLWDANPRKCVGDWHLRPWLVHDLDVKLQRKSIRCKRDGASAMFFLNICSRGLWSLSTTVCLPIR